MAYLLYNAYECISAAFGLLYYLPSLCVCVSLSIWIAAAPDTLQTRTQINRSCKTGKVQRYVESSVFGNLWVSDVMSLFPPSCILIHICGKFEVINSPKLSYSKDIRFVFDVWSNPCRFLCSCSKIKTRGHAEWTDLDRSQISEVAGSPFLASKRISYPQKLVHVFDELCKV